MKHLLQQAASVVLTGLAFGVRLIFTTILQKGKWGLRGEVTFPRLQSDVARIQIWYSVKNIY